MRVSPSDGMIYVTHTETKRDRENKGKETGSTSSFQPFTALSLA